jgi:osmotically-inducible protein OsmY
MIATPQRLEDRLEAGVLTRTGRRVREFVVQVADGVIVLSGRADSFHVKQLATHAVREVLPAAAVRNRITVDDR